MNKKLYVGMAIAGALLWGLNGVASGALFDRVAISPDWLATARLFTSGLLLLIYLVIRKQDIWVVWRNPRDVVLLLAFGIFGVYFAQSNFIRTLYHGNAAIATILQYTAPALIVLALAIYRRVMPALGEMLAVVVAFGGVLLVVTNGDFTTLAISKETLLFGGLSAIGLVGYTLIPRPLLQTQSAVAVTGWGMFLGGVVANFFAPLYQPNYHFDLIDLALLSFIIIGGTVLAFVFYVASLKAVSPEMVGMLGMLEPLSATVLSVIILGIQLQPYQIGGIVMIFAALLLMNYVNSK